MNYEEIAKYRSEDYILRLASEESGELIQAALKYIRAKEGMTPRTTEECRENLVEEMADVTICLMLISAKVGISQEEIQNVIQFKENRLEKRIKTNDYGT